MVVKITSPHSIKRALNYNEQKVTKGQATCIGAEGYLLTPDKLNFYQKLERFTDLISLNDRAKKSNTLHISLNFDPTEKLPQDKLLEIAKSYMERIGFEQQPYLVYEHRDAGHPHIHIVTTNIQSTGKRIDTFNIGRNQSEKARKEIERTFGLVRAAKRLTQTDQDKNIPVQRILYGKSETRQSITNVLDSVIGKFKFSSLAELNAVLNQFNVVADRGVENGRIFNKGGLVYRILDSQGNKVGVPIKASLIYNKPTLKKLEKLFEVNRDLKEPDKLKLKTAVLFTLANKPVSLEDFIAQLKTQNITGVVRRTAAGHPYGITFVDFRTKSVFKGSDLGKDFSVSRVMNAIDVSDLNKSTIDLKQQGAFQTTFSGKTTTPAAAVSNHGKTEDLNQPAIGQFGNRTNAPITEYTGKIPFELLKKKRKKKRHSNN